MATNTLRAEASPERVWAVLADPARYPDWVVGAERIRRVEGDWPHPGAKLHHQLRLGPFRLRDNTEVTSCEPGRCLGLLARGRPFGTARIELRLSADGDGTLISMTERARPWGVPLPPGWLLDGPIWLRNVVSLRRLADAAAPPAGVS